MKKANTNIKIIYGYYCSKYGYLPYRLAKKKCHIIAEGKRSYCGVYTPADQCQYLVFKGKRVDKKEDK